MATVLGDRLTADDLLTMPDEDRYELIDGELVERDMGAKSGWVAGEVFAHLREYAQQNGGWAFPEGTGYRCFGDDSDQVLKPDASYIAAGRLPGDEVPNGFVRIAAEVAVEVVSPSDAYMDVESKVEDYLDAGVRMVWVVNPQQRNVRVFVPGVRPQQLGLDDELTGGTVLPGFSVRVAELFSSV